MQQHIQQQQFMQKQQQQQHQQQQQQQHHRPVNATIQQILSGNYNRYHGPQQHQTQHQQPHMNGRSKFLVFNCCGVLKLNLIVTFYIKFSIIRKPLS